MRQAGHDGDDLLLAVACTRKRIVRGEAGKHAEHGRCGVTLLLREVFPSCCRHPLQYLSGNMSTASVPCLYTFGNLRIEDGHGAQPPESYRVGRPESNEDAYKLVDRYGWVLQKHLWDAPQVSPVREVVVQSFQQTGT